MLVLVVWKMDFIHSCSLVQETDIVPYHYISVSNKDIFEKVYRCNDIMILDKNYQLGSHFGHFGHEKVILIEFTSIKMHLIHKKNCM